MGVLCFCFLGNARTLGDELRLQMAKKVEAELSHLRESARTLAGAMPALATGPTEINEARLLFYLAQVHEDVADDQRVAWLEEGRGKARSAREHTSDSPGSVFWWAANEGGRARLRKSLASLNAIAHIETELLKLREAHPEFGYDAADRMLAAIYLAAPAVISIGSYSKAEASLQNALKRFPDFPGNRTGWIDYLKARGRDEEAKAAANALRASGLLKKEYGEFEYDRPVWEDQLRRAGS